MNHKMDRYKNPVCTYMNYEITKLVTSRGYGKGVALDIAKLSDFLFLTIFLERKKCFKY